MVADATALAVGLGEIKVSRSPVEMLVAYGLGSCVGVGMYDPAACVAGLLHAVLPERFNGAEPTSAKYVDSGLRGLLALLIESGAQQRRLVVRLAGGADMLVAPGFTQALKIGERNVAAARAGLAKLGLQISGEEVGGHSGRTVRLYVADGRMTVRVMGNQEREI